MLLTQDVIKYCEILREDVCSHCGKRGNIEIDHIVPIIMGGKHMVSNLAAMCKSCNRSKGGKSLLQFMLDHI